MLGFDWWEVGRAGVYNWPVTRYSSDQSGNLFLLRKEGVISQTGFQSFVW